MKRETLLDFFDERLRSDAEFCVHDDGYRVRRYSYGTVRLAAVDFAARLAAAGIGPGDKVLFWGENRPEWVMAFWGCLLRGVVVVPIDYRASASFLLKVGQLVDARVLLVGDEVEPASQSGVEVWRFAELSETTASGGEPPTETTAGHVPARDDVAEIIFTSGATSEPKGVIITHRNVLANIVPVEREVLKYRRFGRPFYPLRFLNLLPLSHMFGQALATFIPPMLPGVCVFMRSYSPSAIVHQIHSRRISVLVCVPKILDVLREHVLQIAPEVAASAGDNPHVARRWWRYRHIHRLFGMKFWCFIVGAAPLDPELEAFWSRLGFLVVQGYGLTETAPIVTLNHPFKTRRGTVGTPIAGVEVRIADDGEILVKGENVTTGYFGATADEAAAFEDGWFHTGDLGALDDAGRLRVLGRKKEVIVTPEGLNVFPEDVERVVNAVPGVTESVVVGITRDGEERVHAVVVLGSAADPGAIARAANRELGDHQRIRDVLVWPGNSLPRTEGTQKLKRSAVRKWAEQGAVPIAGKTDRGDRTVASILERVAGGTVSGDTRLDDLGLTSLERVELLMVLENELDASVDERTVTGTVTVADLEALVASPAAASLTSEPEFPVPHWNQSLPIRAIRRLCLGLWLLPLTRLFAWIQVSGLEQLAGINSPVIFAANHQSYMDTPVILAALPPSMRYRATTAMAKEFFAPHFHPKDHTRRARFSNGLNYYLSTALFNAFPLPQREAGTRQALRYAGELIGAGNSVIIYPEGRRTAGDAIDRFQPGAALIAARLGVPVVPVRLRGLDAVLGLGHRMAHPGRVEVTFGAQLRLSGSDYTGLTARLEAAVKAL
jgi:long-chain acyl-CoA synthetase|tara:strand:- start:696 stop:3206 length:2511 start_codon:yes stop_codon:yes gene_type:complete